MRRYPPARPMTRKPWSEHALNIAAMVLAVAIIIAVAPYVRLAVLELMQPAARPAPIPTAAVAPAPRPELVEGPAYRPAAPVYQPAVPTLAPGLVTEAESEAIYQATAGAMLAAPAEGVSEHGSKPSVKVWPTPERAIEVQSAPVPMPDRFGSKPSQKRHP